MKRTAWVLSTVVLGLAACGPAPVVATPTPAPEALPAPTASGGPLQIEDGVLYVALIWHQHQPVYGRDPETGAYVRPWVRVHAAKDYLDMTTTVAAYPDVHVTFNITPSLIVQLDDLAAGAKDQYEVLTQVDASQLTLDQKRYVLEHFFDISPRIISRFARYQELLALRGGYDLRQIDSALATWTDQEFRDLQVLFNLGWTDPDWLTEDPLAGLVARGRDFTEADKDVVLGEHARILGEVIPTLARLQQSGQIEVTTTPFAHPILPLLVDSNLAQIAMPEAELPPRFSYGEDAVAQVQLGAEMYRDHFGVPPRGMWPAEGSVAPLIVSMIAQAGVQWIASDEGVLSHSLPEIGTFQRDGADTVLQADALYRPYEVSGTRGQLAILFRDSLLSDRIGFEYYGTPGQQAAANFLQRLNEIQARLEAEGASGPHLVTVLLDGENAWENYENDGKDFLHALYQGLSDAPNLRAVTPSEYLAATAPPRPLENLWSGSWIDHDFGMWIGEDEENQAWTYLGQTRSALDEALRSGDVPQADADQALRTMYTAEGSDWFWWYGTDQNGVAGVDANFDQQFRRYLEQVYDTIGAPAPDFVRVPIVAQEPQAPAQDELDLLTVRVDGFAGTAEWQNAGRHDVGKEALNSFSFGFDPTTLYLRVDSPEPFRDGTTLGFYLNLPVSSSANAYSRYGRDTTLIGFGAKRLLEITFDHGRPLARVYSADGQGGWDEIPEADESVAIRAAAVGGTLEISAPLARLAPAIGGGDRIHLRLVVSQEGTDVATAPDLGPALLVTPDLPVPNVVLDVTDPSGDDYGPGTYVYPFDGVFVPGVFDMTHLVMGSDEENVIFRITLDGPINNHWGSPNGLSAQTLDIYVDVDGPAAGARVLLPGRNAALTSEFGWDYALWAEGWTPGIYIPSPDGPVEVDWPLKIQTNPGQRRVTISVPIGLIPGDPSTWSIAVAMLGQEGFPATGVWRVREVNAAAEQWRFGGGTSDTNHTRILDVIWPGEFTPDQAALLGTYPASQEPPAALGADDLPQVPMVRVAQ